MAKGGRASIDVNFSEFAKHLEASIARVERGTKRATLAAVSQIYDISQKKVPRDTGTLAASGYFRVDGRYRNFTGVVGYGGNGDPVNPKTGQHASSYMVVVHEDLGAEHPHGGQAKFLEDAVKEYQSQFLSNATAIIKQEL